MDPNLYLGQRNTEKTAFKPSEPVAASVKTDAAVPENEAPTPMLHREKRQKPMGKLRVSGKRFFGQILIDHWIIRINGEQKKVPFGKNGLTMHLPAGMYLVTAYTPYLGMHCNRVTADIEVRPGEVTEISYKTMFDVFRKGVIRQERMAT